MKEAQIAPKDIKFDFAEWGLRSHQQSASTSILSNVILNFGSTRVENTLLKVINMPCEFLFLFLR